MKFDFTGAGVALITPFFPDFKIDYQALARVVENQIAGKMDYLVALGTTAETPTLSDTEKTEVVQFIKATINKRVPLVVGMGGNDTRAILTKMEHFDFEGVNSLLVVTPYYNKPSQEGLYHHFMELAKNSPVPIIMYNVPTRTGVNLETETVLRLLESSDKFAAVKEASGNLSQITRIAKNAPAGFAVISGDDAMALPIISVGGKGVISVIANALPKQISSLIHSALDGDFEKARQFHFELEEIIRLIFLDGNPGGVKALLEKMGIVHNVVRLPLVSVSENVDNHITRVFQSNFK